MATRKAVSKKPAVSKPKTKTVKASVGAKSVNWYDKMCSAVDNKPLVGGVVAEFIGAFLLTAAFLEMQSSPLFVAFALAGIVFIVGGVSGAQLNPAVTVGAWVTRKVKSLTAICFIAAQFIGAGVAWLVLDAFMKNSGSTSQALFHAGEVTANKEWYLLFVELLGSVILSLGVAVAIRNRHNRTAAALTQGFAILIALYISMSLSTILLSAQSTGLTFLNPAVAFAANGIVWGWPAVLFLVTPLVGGVIGFVLRDILYPRHEDCGCDTCEK